MGLLENVNNGHRPTVGIETDFNVRYIKLLDYIKENTDFDTGII